jgi:hypothetical protein
MLSKAWWLTATRLSAIIFSVLVISSGVALAQADPDGDPEDPNFVCCARISNKIPDPGSNKVNPEVYRARIASESVNCPPGYACYEIIVDIAGSSGCKIRGVSFGFPTSDPCFTGTYDASISYIRNGVYHQSSYTFTPSTYQPVPVLFSPDLDFLETINQVRIVVCCLEKACVEGKEISFTIETIPGSPGGTPCNLPRLLKIGNDPVNVEEGDQNSSTIMIMPNPANEILTVFTKGISLSSEVKLKIIDINGKVLQTRNLDNEGNEQITMGISELASGTYFLQIHQAGEPLVQRKFIINR